MPVDTPMTKEMERTPYVTESLRVRCPACRKLYLVQYGDIQEAKPRFECVQCRGRFWLSLPDMDLANELTGIPIQVKEVPASARVKKIQEKRGETEPCPKCFKPVAVGAAECGSCGVMIAKAKDSALAFTEPTVPPHSPALEALWKKVIADYENESLHADFTELSFTEQALPYAAAQYGQMMKIMPTDELTKAKIAEITALADAMLSPASAATPVAAGGLSAAGVRPQGAIHQVKSYPRLWQLPLFGAALLMIAGMWIPFFRNLVGVGAAFLFFAIALQMQFRRRN